MSNEQITEIGINVKPFQTEDQLLKVLMEPDAGEQETNMCKKTRFDWSHSVSPNKETQRSSSTHISTSFSRDGETVHIT